MLETRPFLQSIRWRSRFEIHDFNCILAYASAIGLHNSLLGTKVTEERLLPIRCKIKVMRWAAAFGLLTLLTAGCKSPSGQGLPEEKLLKSQADDSNIAKIFKYLTNPWVLTSHHWSRTNPPFLAADNMGIRIGPNGDNRTGSTSKSLKYSIQDRLGPRIPLSAAIEPMFRGNRYSFQEKITRFQNPCGATIKINGRKIDLSDSHTQQLNLRTGILTTTLWARLNSSSMAKIKVSTAVDRGCVGTEWMFTAPPGTKISWKPNETISGDNIHNELVLSEHSQDETNLVLGYTVKMPSDGKLFIGEGEGFDVSGPLIAGRPQVVESSLRISGCYLPRFFQQCKKDFLQQSKTYIEIKGPIADQAVINSFLFYLRNGEGSAVTPMGLSSAHYDGHVFWDADMWIAPALYLIDPTFVKQFANYRLKRIQNPPSNPFPWESAVSGKERTTVMSKEIHVNGDVLWGLSRENALGFIPPADAKKLKKASELVKKFFQKRLTPGGKHEWQLDDVVSPDENHVGNNDLYTNLLAQWSINNESWKPLSPIRLELPKDQTSFLNYDNDPIRAYKQDAGLLAIYPLQYPPAERVAQIMMKRFANKNIPTGPAMSKSVNALIWARLGHPNRAYKLWEKSWRDYVRTPFLLFSEKPHNGYTYFMTGAAGCLQTVIYGFMGFRIDDHKPTHPGSWSMPLLDGYWLSLHPHLPKAWNSITFNRFFILGKAYNLVIDRRPNGDSIHLTRIN